MKTNLPMILFGVAALVIIAGLAAYIPCSTGNCDFCLLSSSCPGTPPKQTPTDTPTSSPTDTPTSSPTTETPPVEPTTQTSPGPSPTTKTPSPTPTATETSTPTSLTPTLTNTATSTSTPTGPKVGIAIQLDLTNNPSRSTVISNSIRLGFDDFRNEFNFKEAFGFEVELLPVFDDQGSPNIGVQNAKNIVANPQILCVLGHGSSSVALQALNDYYNPSNILVISPHNTVVTLTTGIENSNAVFYRLAGRDDVQPVLAVFEIKELFPDPQIPKVYFIQDGRLDRAAYGEGIKTAFKKASTGMLDFIDDDGIYLDSTDVEALAQTVNEKDPDIVYYAGYPNEAVEIFTAIHNINPNVIFFGPGALDSDKMLSADKNVIGNKFHYTTVGAPPGSFNLEDKAGEYEKIYGIPPGPFFGESYDAVRLCMTAIRQAAQNNQKNSTPTRAEVLEQMRNFANHPYDKTMGTISGSYTFTERGDPKSASYCVGEVVVEEDKLVRKITKCFTCPPDTNDISEDCRSLK